MSVGADAVNNILSKKSVRRLNAISLTDGQKYAIMPRVAGRRETEGVNQVPVLPFQAVRHLKKPYSTAKAESLTRAQKVFVN